MYPTNPATSSTGLETFANPPLPLDSPPKNPPLPKDTWSENWPIPCYFIHAFMFNDGEVGVRNNTGTFWFMTLWFIWLVYKIFGFFWSEKSNFDLLRIIHNCIVCLRRILMLHSYYFLSFVKFKCFQIINYETSNFLKYFYYCHSLEMDFWWWGT